MIHTFATLDSTRKLVLSRIKQKTRYGKQRVLLEIEYSSVIIKIFRSKDPQQFHFLV